MHPCFLQWDASYSIKIETIDKLLCQFNDLSVFKLMPSLDNGGHALKK